MKVQYHIWTKNDIRTVNKLWDTKSTREIAKELGVAPQQVTYLGTRIRLAGFNLAKRSAKGQMLTMIKEALG